MDSDSSQGPLRELTISRARFIAELGERIAALRQGLARMSSPAEPTAELNAVRRRLHALAAAADVLRFTTTAEALTLAEAALATGGAAPGAFARERVGRILDVLPSLVLGASIDLAEELDSPRTRVLREPLCVVVYGDASLESLLHKPGPLHGAESHATQNPEQVLELVLRLRPDILLLDGDHTSAGELVPRLRQAAGSYDLPLVAVASFDQHDPILRLIRRGVSRVLPKPVDAGTLQRTLRQTSTAKTQVPARPSSFRRLTPDQLVEAIAAEARRAFGDTGAGPRAPSAIDFGSGSEVLAALWSAFARIRGLAIETSGGAVQFPLPGPSGAIPIAPAAFRPGRAPANLTPASSAVTLAGRRFVVADSDAAIALLLRRTVEQLGAVVLPARDAAEALALAERHWPDAVLSEPLLPELDGFELCQRLHQDIALGDLPVALVSFREHLLERARHLGEPRPIAQAAIDAESVAPVLRECLQTRAALEQRLALLDEVHARLDGLTPRLVLQLVCSRKPNARVSLRAGRLKFELCVSDGRPVHARLYDGDELGAEGLAVLGPFLGARFGRFSVEPLTSPPPAHFSGDLMTVLDPVITRARRARDRLRAGDVAAIERVVLDPYAVDNYLADSLAAQRPVVTRLLAGAPPRSLTASPGADGGETARLVGTLLDLARQGAVLALLDRDGRDVLSTDAGQEAYPVSDAERTSRGTAPEVRSSVALGDVVLQVVSTPPASELEPPPPPAISRMPSAPRAGAASDVTADSPPEEQAAWSREPLSPSPRVHAEPDEHEDGAEQTPSSAVGASEYDADTEDEDESPWPTTRSARLRSAAGPLLVTLGAAALAFFGIRAIANNAWQTHSGALRAPLSSAPDAGAPRGTTARLAPAPELGSDEAGLLSEQRKVPVNVTVDSELLDLPPHTKLRPGHGLLEVRTWERQQIYVDGVFMGNYENRLIPLGPGTYQLRLRDGARDIERPVVVQAGRRTRLRAQPKSSK